ncbi:MAG: LCP family protein [Lachnospiraceae bacterium]|nr:LCP family protein [Lachnospiraceae bacterium]
MADTKVKKEKKRSTKRKKLMATALVVEALMLVVLVGSLWVVGKLDKIQSGGLNAEMNEGISEEAKETMKGYTNIALFGIDTRTMGDGKSDLGPGNRSDTIIIASINNETGVVKMVSVYRDTYLNLANDKYNKCNGAYSAGGAEQAVQMLMMNLDLNIEYYVSVDFLALIEVVDLLGGIEVDVDDQEWGYVNDYILETAYVSGVNTTLLEGPGLQTLDGVQATSYCRIRYTAGSDYKRTERQREVLTLIANKAKTMGVGTLIDIVDEVFPQVLTNFTSAELIAKAADAMNYEIGETMGFPIDKTGVNLGTGYGQCVIPANLEENVKELHKFLFDEEDYYPSPTVIKISDKIAMDTGVYE